MLVGDPVSTTATIALVPVVTSQAAVAAMSAPALPSKWPRLRRPHWSPKLRSFGIRLARST